MSNSSQKISYGQFTDPFIKSLAAFLDGKRVLEVFAGNGLLASKLADKGLAITATSLFSGHDGHQFGMCHDVIEMDVISAVSKYGPLSDVLLMSWPTVTESAANAALLWGPGKPIVFIGEITDYSRNHLGGCATDRFFEFCSIDQDLPGYTPRNVLERAVVMQVRPEVYATLEQNSLAKPLDVKDRQAPR